MSPRRVPAAGALAPAAAEGISGAAWGGYRLVPLLLVARLRMLRNTLLGSAERRGWTLVGAVVVAGLAAAGVRLAVATLDASDPAPGTVRGGVAGVGALVAGFTLVTAVTFALSALYFARDLEALLVAPLPGRAVLLTKVLVQLGTGTAIGVVLGGPALAVYLARHGALAALPWIGLCIVAMATIPLLAGTALTVVVVRVLPARRVRDAAGLLVTATVFGATAVNLSLRGPEGFTGRPGLLDPGRQGGVADAAWLPTGWMARSVVAAMRGDAGAAALWGVPMAAGAVALLLLAARLLEGAFLEGHQRSLEAGRGRTRRRGARVARGQGRRPHWLVIAAKDLKETLRDPSQLGQLLLPLALFALFIASPTAQPGVGVGSRLPAWWGTALTAGFASLFAASGVGLRGVGLEGRRLWLLRVSPVRPGSVLIAKYASGAVVAVALGLLLTAIGVVRLRLGPLEALLVGLRLVAIVGGLVGLAVGFGAVRPRLDWTDPRRSVGIWTSVAFLAVGASYLGGAFLLLALPYAASAAPGRAAIAAADVTLWVVAVAVVGSALRIGASRLRALEL